MFLKIDKGLRGVLFQVSLRSYGGKHSVRRSCYFFTSLPSRNRMNWLALFALATFLWVHVRRVDFFKPALSCDSSHFVTVSKVDDHHTI